MFAKKNLLHSDRVQNAAGLRIMHVLRRVDDLRSSLQGKSKPRNEEMQRSLPMQPKILRRAHHRRVAIENQNSTRESKSQRYIQCSNLKTATHIFAKCGSVRRNKTCRNKTCSNSIGRCCDSPRSSRSSRSCSRSCRSSRSGRCETLAPLCLLSIKNSDFVLRTMCSHVTVQMCMRMLTSMCRMCALRVLYAWLLPHL